MRPRVLVMAYPNGYVEVTSDSGVSVVASRLIKSPRRDLEQMADEATYLSIPGSHRSLYCGRLVAWTMAKPYLPSVALRSMRTQDAIDALNSLEVSQ